MWPRHDDILSRIAEPPTWWFQGVPHYDAFTPGAVTIYGRDVVLVHSACQMCGQRFDVA